MRPKRKTRVYGLFVKRIGVIMKVLEGQEFGGLSVTKTGKFDMSMFSVVCKVRRESVLHVLEPLFIKSLKPDLCKQVEFVKCLHLFSNT